METKPDVTPVDVNALRAAMTPVAFTIDGQTYTGRHMSHLQFVKRLDDFRKWLSLDLKPEEATNQLRELMGDMGFGPEAAEKLLAEPPYVVETTLARFFRSHRSVSNGKPSPTDGTSSPQPGSAGPAS